MPNIVNGLGQVKVGVKPTPPPPPSTLMSSIYSAYNADSQGLTSLKTSLYGVYNGESNTNDSYGTNNGTAIGGLTYSAGLIGQAFESNGVNSYITYSKRAFNFTNSFSVSMWIRPSVNQTAIKALVASYHYADTDYGWVISLTTDNKVRFFWINNGFNAYNSTSSINLNQWNHIVVVWDKTNTNWKMYINNVLDINLTTANASNINYHLDTIPNICSSSSNPSYSYNGKMDAVNFWQKVLTQSEITELYNSGNGAQYITDNFYKPTTTDALNTYNGTAQGGLTYGVGKVGTAFQFNGTNAYVQLGDVMDVGTSSWSYSFWFKTNDAVSVGVPFSKSFANGAINGRIWAAVYNNKFEFSFQPENANVITIETPANSMQSNTWYHVVCVLDRNDKLKMYLNGSLQTVTVASGINILPPYSAVNYNNTMPFRIGAYTAADNTTPIALFNGQIDTFNAWNRVLTASEITELYNSGNGKQYPF